MYTAQGKWGRLHTTTQHQKLNAKRNFLLVLKYKMIANNNILITLTKFNFYFYKGKFKKIKGWQSGLELKEN